ncbi:MAG TPA: Gfo/Idh/MocA family oxidoreductase [Tepidisphaeraceae bacterium]|nr:Gfo/Idh/MocA family oxidoreductase [Tepidisphaeraceae bacterium]
MPTIALAGVAHIHVPGFISILKNRTDTTVKSVWDAHSPKAQKRADELGATVVSKLSEIVNDPEIDGVIVASETSLHEQLVVPLAQSGKHLFVEKPLGLGAADAQRMADAISTAGVKFQTGYVSRSVPAHIKLKSLVDAGFFGKISRVRASVCHSGALAGWFDRKPNEPESDWSWMADPKQAGVGAFGDLGAHGLDLLMWLFGPITKVAASISLGTGRYPGCDETGEALLVFESGTIGTLAAGWVDRANPVSLEISGSNAHASIVNDQLSIKRSDGKMSIDEALPPWRSHSLNLILDALAGQPVELVTAEEAARRSEVMEAIYRASKCEGWVKIG